MSLDVNLYKVVRPEEADYHFDLRNHPPLKAFQKTGILCVQDLGRFGRNCMNKKWHWMDDKGSQSRDGKAQNEDWWGDGSEKIRIFTPDTIDKFMSYLKWPKELKEDHGSWWDKESFERIESWDFLRIDW